MAEADKTTTTAPARTKGQSGKAGTATGRAARKTAPPAKKTAPAAEKAPAAKKAAPPKKTVKAGRTAEPAEESGPANAGTTAKATKKGAKKVVAKKTAAGTAATGGPASAVPTARIARPTGVVAPGDLAVRPDEEPWSAEEVDAARAELLAEMGRLRTEITTSEDAITGLLRDSGDGAGDDQADTGTKNITREHEMALTANAREMLAQTEHALERLDSGTYGLCESCGKPIGKARMQAFPRATLCVDCKQRQERRY
ncbi:TraR/DksA family transcriptional regulator [Streptomyces sp. NPDC088354]|uniref:TraR/DksA family transcriptional regulator n=1 Tax=unclassified Streptomyces TaxID=2593676 RepID=UPI0029C9BDF0|nr:TraR/DksA family transcriptional regulator [Streptomyces sp. MI02-7b]